MYKMTRARWAIVGVMCLLVFLVTMSQRNQFRRVDIYPLQARDEVARLQARDEEGKLQETEALHLIVVFPLLLTDTWKKQGYNTTDLQLVKRREKEYVDSLQKNIQLPTVSKIHIFSDQPQLLRRKLTSYDVSERKLHFQQSSSNPTYRDLFTYVSDNLQRRLVFIVNADNFLGEGFDQVNISWWQTNPKTLYALTRHSLKTDNKECKMGPIGYCDANGTYYGSHDGFMFCLHNPLPQEFLKELAFPSHACGSENVVIWAVRKFLKFKVTNPCRRLVIYHNHCTNMRAPDSQRARVNVGGKSGLADYSW
ncbi:uncharacterized protein LOC135478002 isoform X2 [Liolophura sinensis]|uniref:uncharacterized protein LOC135478002 isoform X2 n=1 Tax=Liolophura sinensis TaxID=3198878 RepID=UPI003158304B